MKNERVQPSFVVACVYDLRVCHCSRCITNLKKGATLTSLYLACVDHNARLPNFSQEVFSHAMLQQKLDKHVHFSKAVNLFVKYFLFIFQQLTLTAAATNMIVAAVLVVSSIRIFLFCAFTIFFSSFLSLALWRNTGRGLLILEVSRSHTTTHHSR